MQYSALNQPLRGVDPIRAILDYTEAIRLNPGYADAYYNRGLTYIKLNKKEEAIADFQKAAQLYQQLGRNTSYQDALKRLEEFQ